MVAGCDLSTKAIDIVALDENNPAQCQHLRIPLNNPWWTSATDMRLTFSLNRVYDWLEQRNVYLVGVERPYGRQLNAVTSLHTILGAVLATLPVTAFEVSPADMRRELGLPGNCGKAAMHDTIANLIQPNITWPGDAYDAWAAAYAAMKINERGTPLEAA